MLFPSIASRTNFATIFKNVSRVLKCQGFFVAATMNPCFDGYMQKMLFDREDIESKFKGYYNSPSKYVVRREKEGKKVCFRGLSLDVERLLKSWKRGGFSVEGY
ncbi:MAG: hypothetical protein ABIE03_02920 [Patescibacteria group bacterium]|nr:hypothetical protein [Patescibacteria group bacterium]